MEVVIDLYQFRNDPIVAKDYNKTEKKNMRDELTQRESTLVKAGESILNMVINRTEKNGSSGISDIPQVSSS